MFPCLPTSGKIVAETKFAFQEAKMFPKKFRNVFVADTMFPSFPRYNVFKCFQREKHCFPDQASLKNVLRLYSANVNNIYFKIRAS